MTDLKNLIERLNAEQQHPENSETLDLVLSWAVSALEAQAAEIAELREALKPFAAIEPTILSAGSSLPWEQPEEPLEAKFYWVVLGSPNKVSFTDEDLLRARAKLQGSGA
jgi:hypothetical protein